MILLLLGQGFILEKAVDVSIELIGIKTLKDFVSFKTSLTGSERIAPQKILSTERRPIDPFQVATLFEVAFSTHKLELIV